jgi:hypothetical protein
MRVRKKSGQSLIEFLLSLSLGLVFTFFFIQYCLFFVFGNYAQYATFMASRAYLSSGVTESEQKSRAIEVLNRTLVPGGRDRIPGIARGQGGGDAGPGVEVGSAPEFSRDNKDLSWMEGVRYTFRGKLFPLGLSGSASAESVSFVTLTSESTLGREPSYTECVQYLSRFGTLGDGVVIDNGC